MHPLNALFRRPRRRPRPRRRRCPRSPALMTDLLLAVVMAVVAVAAILAAVMTSFSACTPAHTAQNDFAYADAPFTASVRGTFTRTAPDGYTGNPALTGTSLTDTPQSIAFTLSAEAPRGRNTPNSGERDMTVTFTEPSSLAGVTVSVVYGSAADTSATDISAADTSAGDAGDGAQTLARTVTVTRSVGGDTQTITDTAGAFDGLLRFAEALLPVGDIAEVSQARANGSHTVTRRTSDGTREMIFSFSDEQKLPIGVRVSEAEYRLELTVTEGG